MPTIALPLKEPPNANSDDSNEFLMFKNIYFAIKLKKFDSFSVNFSNVTEIPGAPLGVPPIALPLKESPNANFDVSNEFLMLKNIYFDIKLKKFV